MLSHPSKGGGFGSKEIAEKRGTEEKTKDKVNYSYIELPESCRRLSDGVSRKRKKRKSL